MRYKTSHQSSFSTEMKLGWHCWHDTTLVHFKAVQRWWRLEGRASEQWALEPPTLSQNPVGQPLTATVASEELSNCFSRFNFFHLSTPIQPRKSHFSFKRKRFYNRGSASTSWKIFLKKVEKKVLLQSELFRGPKTSPRQKKRKEKKKGSSTCSNLRKDKI